ncbi:MAG TPA: ubiquinol-cytochrome C chaperone family protein [Aliidongia sp.]|uniref:ubiquinol-cytochrome C chaperone family protein n=1 Tax=Aliidongia sp. TaxID=1914230 RepID=UPI002DDD2950|nr:ubiquinol-cytochrome C chaperone family protein [Aliidongia sp.]HEV2677116.1 ubiquinol-cytochrome C chaperone family protein [Aliidongia sp.]
MAFARLFGHPPEKIAAAAVHRAAVDQARLVPFYADHGVPDTLDGRFEMIVLHAFLVLHRLSAHPEAQKFGQALYDVLFGDMDRALREMGTGDLSVGKQVKRMAEGFAGRIKAYRDGLAGTGDLREALRRNLYGTASPREEDLDFMAAYLQCQVAELAGQDAAAITAGTAVFAAPRGGPHEAPARNPLDGTAAKTDL